MTSYVGAPRWMWVIGAAALALYAWQIGAAPFWYDESGSVWMASLPVDRLIAATAGDTHPPLYLLMLAGVERLLGPEPWAMRMPSLVFALAALILTWRIGQDLLNAGAWQAGLALAALSVFQVHYAQEARMYTLLQTLVLGAMWAALRTRLLLFVLCSALALWTHNYGLIYLAVNSGVLAWVIYEQQARWKVSTALVTVAVCGGAALLAWSPWAWVLAGQMRTVAEGYWIQPVDGGSLVQALTNMLWGTTLPQWLRPTGVLVAVGLLAWVTVRAVRRRERGPLILLWVVLAPLALVIAASVVWKPILLFRGFAPSVPLMWMLAGWAVAGTVPVYRWYALALVVPLMAGSLVGHALWNVEHKTTLGPAAERVAREWRPGDVVIFSNDGLMMDGRFTPVGELPSILLPRCGQNNIGALSPPTREAMGMVGQNPDAAEWRRAWLFTVENPMLTECEVERTRQFLATHRARLVETIRDNPYVLAELWVVER